MINLTDAGKQSYSVDGIAKSLIVSFPYGGHDPITNDQIVRNSFKFTERLCTLSELKLGLAEANEIQFSAVGIGNIKGYTIDVRIRPAVYDEDTESYPGEVFLGRFVVTKCERSAKSMQTRKITALSEDGSTRQSSAVKSAKLNQITNANTTTTNYDLVKDAIGEIGYMNPDEAKSIFSFSEIEYMYTDPMSTIPIYRIIGPEFMYNGRREQIRVSLIGRAILDEGSKKNRVYYLELNNPDYLSGAIDYYNDLKADRAAMADYFPSIEAVVSSAGSAYILKYDLDTTTSRYKYGYSRVPYNSFTYPYVTLPSGSTQTATAESFVVPYKIITSAYYYSDGNGWSFDWENDYTIDDPSISLYNVATNLPAYNVTLSRKKANTGGYVIDASIFPPAADMFDGMAELLGAFGHFDRTTGDYILKSIGDSTPVATIAKDQYNSIWYSDNFTKPYRAAVANYTNASGNSEYVEVKIRDVAETDNPDNYQVYDVSGNPILAKMRFTEANIKVFLQKIADVLANVQYMPIDADLVGLPYLEAGDWVNIETEDGVVNTIILERTMSGEMTLEDSWEADGETLDGDGSGGVPAPDSYRIEHIDQILGAGYDNLEEEAF